jgi:hypothetical protein
VRARAKSKRTPRTKSGHDPIRQLPLADLHPSPENDLLYRPASPGDADMVALVGSIRRYGVREPLVVTLDNFILSGHRRYTAAGIAGLKHVPCRVENLRRADTPRDAYVAILREYNRQRVKSFDEVVREEVVSADPKEAHRLLVEHRQAKARVQANAIQIEGVMHRARITAAKFPFLNAIIRVLNDYREVWPLSVRQIHYYLLNDPPLKHASKPDSRYVNNKDSYKSLDELLVRARVKKIIPFQAIHDPTRPVVTWALHREVGAFVRDQLGGFLKGYYRDLQQSQPNHLEIIGEKNTIASIIRPVAAEYCIPYTLGRGYSSLPPRLAMRERFLRSGKEILVLVVVSDFDPEGEDVGPSFMKSMRDDFGIKNIILIKAALTASQVATLNLQTDFEAKRDSSRYKKFVARNGLNVFEVEAVTPAQLQGFLREVIASVLDLDAFNAEVDAEAREAARLHGLRERFLRFAAQSEDGILGAGEEE